MVKSLPFAPRHENPGFQAQRESRVRTQCWRQAQLPTDLYLCLKTNTKLDPRLGKWDSLPAGRSDFADELCCACEGLSIKKNYNQCWAFRISAYPSGALWKGLGDNPEPIVQKGAVITKARGAKRHEPNRVRRPQKWQGRYKINYENKHEKSLHIKYSRHVP